jgi:hypothetical protein
MKTITFCALLFVSSLGLTMTGCGKTCTDEDEAKCTQSYTTCQSSCNPLSGMEQCDQDCRKTFCSCLDNSGCNTSSECSE